VKEFQVDLDTLSLGKEGFCPLFANKDGTSLSREYLDRELNAILQEASLLLSKHLRTHYFRASYIRELLNV
jgi:site-specific recombinase XerD